ncbi:MAG: integrase, partial [Pseudolabrys sp.]
TRAAENGATVAQLEAIFGWKGGRMASLYTESADRRRLAIEAMGKLANSGRTSMDAPLHKVRPPGRKSK